MNIKTLDKICLNQQEINNLLEWRNNNKEYVREYKAVLDSGLIEITNENRLGYIFFKSSDNSLHLEYYNKDRNNDNIECLYETDFIRLEDRMFKLMNVKKHQIPVNSSSYYLTKNFGTKEWEECYNGILTIYCSTMAYMTYFEPEFITVEESIKYKESRQKKLEKTAKYNPNHKVRLNKKIYTLNPTTKYKTVTKKMYNKHMESWGVRGHWRKMKDKKVWISPYVKGSGKSTNKVYEFKIEVQKEK